MFDFFDRLSEYQEIEKSKGSSRWGDWISMEDETVIPDMLHCISGEDDPRIMYQAQFLFSDQGLHLTNDQARELMNKKITLMSKLLRTADSCGYVQSVDFGGVYGFDKRGISADADSELAGFDILLRSVPENKLESELSRIYSLSQDKLGKTVVTIAEHITKALLAMDKEKLRYCSVEPKNIIICQRDSSEKYQLAFPLIDLFFKADENDTVRNEYTAPELISDVSRIGDQQTDIYSVGLLMYGLLNNGRLPFEDNNTSRSDALKTRNKGETEICSPLKADDQLSYIVRKCLAHNRRVRYGSYQELLEDLNNYGGYISSGSGKELNISTLREELVSVPEPVVSLEKPEIKPEPVPLEKPERKQVLPPAPAPSPRTGNFQRPDPTAAGYQPPYGQNQGGSSGGGGYQPPYGQNQSGSSGGNQNSEPVHNNGVPVGALSTGGNSTLKVVIIVLAVLALLGLGILGSMFFLSKQPAQNNSGGGSSSAGSSSVDSGAVGSTDKNNDSQDLNYQTDAPAIATEEPTITQTIPTTVQTTAAPTTTVPVTTTVEHKYEFVAGKVTWEEAERNCKTAGGKLATMHSEDDWNKIIACVEGARAKNPDLQYVWLGGRTTPTFKDNNTIEISFRWTDDSDTSYIYSGSGKCTHWFFSNSLNSSEPSGIDIYEYKNTGNKVAEPYLLLWYISAGNGAPKEWSMNDAPDVTDPKYTNYKDSNMGYIIEYGG